MSTAALSATSIVQEYRHEGALDDLAGDRAPDQPGEPGRDVAADRDHPGADARRARQQRGGGRIRGHHVLGERADSELAEQLAAAGRDLEGLRAVVVDAGDVHVAAAGEPAG